MVYYPISVDDLRQKIGNSWLQKADQRTQANRAGQRLIFSDSIWSEIKPVYMELQFDKCVYCEFPLGGRSTQDVEHYRPKSKISAWPRKPTYGYATGDARTDGYYWLAYDPQNYAASCKDCNSALKRDCFPIAAARGDLSKNVVALNKAEKPFLLFPFGDWGDDPSKYLEYEGIFVRPRQGLAEARRRRAEITIDFFQLNKRRSLLRERYRVIGLIWANVELRQTSASPNVVARAEATILENIIDEAPQALCARSFLELMQSDPLRATTLAEGAKEHLKKLGYLTIGGG